MRLHKVRRRALGLAARDDRFENKPLGKGHIAEMRQVGVDAASLYLSRDVGPQRHQRAAQDLLRRPLHATAKPFEVGAKFHLSAG